MCALWFFSFTVINTHIWYNSVSKELDVCCQSEKLQHSCTQPPLLYVLHCHLFTNMGILSKHDFTVHIQFFLLYFALNSELMARHSSYSSLEPFSSLQGDCLDSRPVIWMKLGFLIDHHQRHECADIFISPSILTQGYVLNILHRYTDT